MTGLLICTDLDRTLIPNGAEPESPGARELFARLVERDDVHLAYVSGRHKELIEEAIAHYDLPVPDFAIADVGSTIYKVEAGRWIHWDAWDRETAMDWRGKTAFDLRHLLEDLTALKLQEPEKQNTHKLSHYVDLDHPPEPLVETVTKRMAEAGFRANVIWSVDEEKGCGLLDILPPSANKLHAIRFMMTHEAVDVAHTVFAGDSGNDLDVLLSPLHSILVANASREALEAVESADPENLYIAKGGFLGMNGCYGAGILEGIAHFCPEYAPVITALKQGAGS
ncbi:MAG: HAD-IIB family hydrolase [Alphaproteobacteria bacterium]|nr:HAD-IIB family hydrolase [Alphaproteobacteria bacterium]